MRDNVGSEVSRFLPGLIRDFFRQLDEGQSIRRVLKERIAALDLNRLEEVILRIAGKELRRMEFLGAVLGAAIGLMNAAAMHLFAMDSCRVTLSFSGSVGRGGRRRAQPEDARVTNHGPARPARRSHGEAGVRPQNFPNAPLVPDRLA